jgi:hypothetical protein
MVALEDVPNEAEDKGDSHVEGRWLLRDVATPEILGPSTSFCNLCVRLVRGVWVSLWRLDGAEGTVKMKGLLRDVDSAV